MKWFFAPISRALHDLTDEIRGLHLTLQNTSHGDDEISNRVAALERDIAKRSAEAEALVMRAESQFSAARASEERTRRMRNAEAAQGDGEGDEDGLEGFTPEEIAQALSEYGRVANGGGGAEGGVSPVRADVVQAAGPRARKNAAALRAKYG